MPFYIGNGWVGAVSPTLNATTSSTSGLWYYQNQTGTSGIYQNSTGMWVSAQDWFNAQHQQQHWVSAAESLYAPAVQRESYESQVRREAQRDQELYQRAVAENDLQEMARINALRAAREAVRVQRQQAQAAAEQQARENARLRAAANARAIELLRENLTAEQLESFNKNGWFVVEGGRSKTRYRINSNSIAGNVHALGKKEEVIHRLCCHVPYQENLPPHDHFLAQKLMLQYAEDDFLRLANRH